MSDIYDSAFRTILNDCRQLILPVINEAFGERYRGDEEVDFSPNEHFIDQQDEADRKVITDTNFVVRSERGEKFPLRRLAPFCSVAEIPCFPVKAPFTASGAAITFNTVVRGIALSFVPPTKSTRLIS